MFKPGDRVISKSTDPNAKVLFATPYGNLAIEAGEVYTVIDVHPYWFPKGAVKLRHAAWDSSIISEWMPVTAFVLYASLASFTLDALSECG